ncbi:hypothetical protein ONZ45_g11762 [Pleurotus djamor]|nr:hypothetical protein ONZ45_g11762 [Pleurotus djamor]
MHHPVVEFYDGAIPEEAQSSSQTISCGQASSDRASSYTHCNDMSRYSRYPPFGEHDHFPAVTPSAVPSAIYESEAGPPHEPHEIHASVEPDRPRGVQLVDPPVRSHPQLHEHFTNSDDERSDGMDERSSRRRVDRIPSQPHSHSRSRSSHSHSHSHSHSRITQAPYMGRAQTPYHASEASVAESHPSDIRIQPDYLPEAQVPSSLPSRAAPPPVARQPTSERMPRSHDDRASSRRPTKTQAPQHQYTPYVHPVQPTRAYSNSRRDNNMPPSSKNHYDAQPPFPLGVDANTYCYIVPRGTNVIFQDEDGHEITRIGQFQHPSNRSEDTLDYESPTRKRTVPIIVQDEYGQELYRSCFVGREALRIAHSTIRMRDMGIMNYQACIVAAVGRCQVPRILTDNKESCHMPTQGPISFSSTTAAIKFQLRPTLTERPIFIIECLGRSL